MMKFLHFIFLYIFYIKFDLVYSNDILGCGGYVKSDVEINFSKVGIKLLTSQGNLKYETDCAPNNGYYFIPLYNKGEYILKVSPPPGWSFEPEQLELKVDGETDPCFLGHDINFHFKGFAVIGKVVSAGTDVGPAGVKVSLYDEQNKFVMDTLTSEGGNYVFTPLASSTYTVVATHPTWHIAQNKVTVEVTDQNGDTGNSLVVSGYSLTGSVATEGKATSDVVFILHSDKKGIQPSGCLKNIPKEYKSKISTPAVCAVRSNTEGKFLISLLSPGTYLLVPFYQTETTVYEVLPKQLKFNIEHKDKHIQEPFQVDGFSVQGTVLFSEGGKPVPGAVVDIDGTSTTTTDDNGRFVFHSIKWGMHKINVKADHMEFDEYSMKISAQEPILKPIIPTRFEVCFSVVLDKASHEEQSWEVIVKKDNSKDKFSKAAILDSDRCLYLPRGSYAAHVNLPQNADETGIRFGPHEHIFTISSEPIGNLLFSQYLETISGNIICIEKCPELDISLKPVRGAIGGVRTTTTINGKFSFPEVVPGTYQVSIHKDEWCWDQKSIDVNVNTEDVDVTLKQTGYKLTISASHGTKINQQTKDGKKGSFNVEKGTTKQCISSPGVYTFSPVGCHKYGASNVQWDTNSPTLITLAATHHLLTGYIHSKEDANFMVDIKDSNGHVTTVKSLKRSKTNAELYEFEHFVKEGEAVTIIPSSDKSLHQYEPSTFKLTMPEDCLSNAITFTAERALFIYGKVNPGVADVTIKVSGNDKVHKFVTDAKGNYVAGPLDNSVTYTIEAEKIGYTMTELAEKGNFEAFKLSQINVKVLDEENLPIKEVLVSTSGGKNYRMNSLSDSKGIIAFQELMPGDYFLRPIMQEYLFNPSSEMVSLAEGQELDIVFKGQRTAYSIFGQTVSLSREYESDVTVEAVGVAGPCKEYQEEALSDKKGYFRIRGLMPNCDYELRLKKGKKINANVERALPASQIVKVIDQDIKDMKLIVMRPFLQMDVAVMVKTNPEHLSSLSAKLYRDDLPDSPIHSVKLGAHPYFMFPPMTADNKSYVLQLFSTLSTSQYQYKLPEIVFKANGPFKHLTVEFYPTYKSIDAEMNQSTVMGLVFGILCIVLVINYKKFGLMVDRVVDWHANATTSKPVTVPSFDTPEIEPVMKKKAKARKI